MDMARKTANSADMLMLGARAWGLWVETAMVMNMRMLGMAGLWAVRPDENLRMMAEKPPAFSDAAIAGASALWAGKRPDQIAVAAMAPLTRKARANRRRLSRAGLAGPTRRR
jgi:hypothetical protein